MVAHKNGPPRLCSFGGCMAIHQAKSFCQRHYLKLLRYGTPFGGRPHYLSDIDHFMSKVEKTDSCWLWKGTIDRKGYGQYTIPRSGGKKVGAHRYAYQIFKGMIPQGREPDHLCRVRHCCNPEHLEAVTRSENLRRGLVGHKIAEIQRLKTHCPQRHLYDDTNTYRNPDGKRVCRQCAREHGRVYDRTKRKSNRQAKADASAGRTSPSC